MLTFHLAKKPCGLSVFCAMRLARLENRTMLFNVAEDFKRYTLKVLPTLLEKLAYISSLQDSDGRYRHWGLSRLFGHHRAQKGIGAVHSELATNLIRVPIRDIYRDYSDQRAEHPEFLEPESLALKAPANGDELLSVHLQLIQGSLVAVAAHESVPHQVA